MKPTPIIDAAAAGAAEDEPLAGMPANWALHALEAWRLIYGLREQVKGLREALQVTVAMLAEHDQELDRVRERYHALLEERRRAA